MSAQSAFEDLEYYQRYRPEAGEIDLRSYLLDEEDLAEKIASGFYPTPTVLARLQRALGQEPRDPDARDVGPFPPRRLKSEIFDAEKYTAKDNFVKLLLPKPFESEAEFAVRLFEQCGSNLDTVRAAFCFVCSVSVEDLVEVAGETEFYSQVRQMRKNSDEALIFDWLISLTSVPSRKIRGYKKGAQFESGMEAKVSGGNWTACYVEGEWRLVDPMWGAHILSGFDTGNYAKLDDAGNVGSVEQSEGRIIYGCNEFYFLTDPENLILTHFPIEDTSQWQLLARPLTLAEFQRMPKFFSGSLEEMFHYSIIPESHPLNVIPAPPGNIEVYLKEAAGQMYEYEAKVSIHKSSINDLTRAAIKQQACINGYLSKMTRMGKDTVRFKFVPPCSAKFMLSIFLKRSVEYPEKSMTVVTTIEYVSYVIHCPRADTSAMMLPQGSSELMHFGAGAELSAAGLRTEEPGEIRVTDGEKLIQLDSTDHQGRHNLECQLYGPGNESLPSNSLLIWIVGPKISVQFLSPDAGTFALVLRDSGVPVCQFLLDSSSEFRDSQDFPLPDLESLGGLGVSEDELQELIRPLSHPNPYVVCEKSSLELRFAANVHLDIKAELFHTSANGQAEELSGYTFVTSDNEGFTVDVRFKIAGHYVVKLFVRRKSSGPWRRYQNYFIRCVGQLDGHTEQFPDALPAWKSENLLVQPKQKLLPLNEPVSISVRISDPDIRVAYLLNESKNEHTMMQQDQDNFWQGSIEGLSDSAGSSVKVLGGPSKNMCAELLAYRFESPKDHTIRNLEMRTAAKLNLSRLGNERLRKRKQVNHERKEKALDPLTDVPLDEEWAGLQMESDLRRLLQEDEPTLVPETETITEMSAGGPTSHAVVGEEADGFQARAPISREEVEGENEGHQAPGERAALTGWLNKNLRTDPDCEKYLPIEDICSEIQGKFDDGVLLCGVINAVSQDTIDKRALRKGSGMSKSDRVENVTMALNSAQSLGIPVSSDAAEVASNPKLLLQLLWQLIWLELTESVKQATAADSERLRAMFPETEERVDIRGTTPDQMLIKWVNYHLRMAGSQRTIGNFSQDVSDSEAYAYLLQQIAPPEIRDCMHSVGDIVAQTELLTRAQMVLENTDLLDAREFLQPDEIVGGNPNLNMAFVANLFNRYPSLPEPEQPEGDSKAEQASTKKPETVREEKTYTNWMNSVGVQPRINYLYTDARSGLQYLQLLDQIRPGLVQWSRVHQVFQEKRANFQRLENCNYAVELGKQLGFSLVGIGGQDLVSGNETLTLAILRQLVTAIAPATLAKMVASADGRVEKSRQLIDERAIIEWTNERLQRGGKELRLYSFKDSSMGDSRCLLDLIDCLRPGSVNYDFVLPGSTEAERLQNARLAISLSWRAGAKVFATPADLVQARPQMVMSVFAALMQLHFQAAAARSGSGHRGD